MDVTVGMAVQIENVDFMAGNLQYLQLLRFPLSEYTHKHECNKNISNFTL